MKTIEVSDKTYLAYKKLESQLFDFAIEDNKTTTEETKYDPKEFAFDCLNDYIRLGIEEYTESK